MNNDPDQARGVRNPGGGGLVLRKPIWFRSGQYHQVRFEIRTESGKELIRSMEYVPRTSERSDEEIVIIDGNLPLPTGSELCVVFLSPYGPAEPTVFRLGLVEDARVADGTLRIGPCLFERDEQHPNGYVVGR